MALEIQHHSVQANGNFRSRMEIEGSNQNVKTTQLHGFANLVLLHTLHAPRWWSTREGSICNAAQELPLHQRGDAVSSLVYEANARVRDPVYGCVGAISFLQNQVSNLQMQLAVAQAEILCIQMQQEPVAATLPASQMLDHHQYQDHDQKSLLLSNTHDFSNIPQYVSSFGSSSNVIQDPLKRESLRT